jgi:magnesium-transporting ATPase (P-type)
VDCSSIPLPAADAQYLALALATEKPSKELLERKPYGRYESLITPRMYRFILGSAALQIIVLLSLVGLQRQIWFFEDVDAGRYEDPLVCAPGVSQYAFSHLLFRCVCNL